MSRDLQHRLATSVVRHRYRWLVLWLVVTMTLLPPARTIGRRLQTGVKIPRSDAALVDGLLATRFNSPFARFGVLVIRGLPSVAEDSAARATLAAIATDLRDVDGVAGTVSFSDAHDSVFVGKNGGTFIIVGLVPPTIDDLLPVLRARSASIRSQYRARYPNLELLWTGTGALTADLRVASASDASRAERRVVPLIIVLLTLAFGSLVAACIPVAIGALAIVLALGAAALASHVLPLSILLLNVTTMLGLGLGIDYALLLVSRFREQRSRGAPSEEAAIEALASAGHTIVLAAATVLLGFSALLIVPLSDLRSIAIGGLLVTAASMLLATTLLPGVLAMLGSRIDTGRVWRFGDGTRIWGRWSLWMARHPLIAMVVFGAPVVILAAQWTRLERRMPNGDWLPPQMESARGLTALREMGRGGVVQSIRVLVRTSDSTSIFAPKNWPAMSKLEHRLAQHPGISRVRSLVQVLGDSVPSTLTVSFLPSVLLQSFVSTDGRIALLEAEPADTLSGSGAMEIVRQLRDDSASFSTGGMHVTIGGLPAVNVDYESAIGSATPRVVALVIVGTMLALFIGFRSVLVPIKAVALNLLAVGAAFGLVVLVFQQGHGARLLGLSAPLDGIFAAVPLIVFCTVFGLSMDYEVFLVSRVAEARRRGLSDGAAVVAGVRRTGRVITSAAFVMTTVFAAFMLGDFVLMKILGFALTAAVIIDVTVVRLAIGPALLVVAGRWNWWPGTRRGAGGLRRLSSAAVSRSAPTLPARSGTTR